MLRRSQLFRNHLLIAAFLCSWSLAVYGQSAAPSAAQQQSFPVTVEGREVFTIYDGVGPFSAQDRAQRVSERLSKLTFTRNTDLANIGTSESEYGTEVRFGETVLTVVTDNDAQRMHVSRAALAKYYTSQIRTVIDQIRQEHAPKALIRAAIYAVLTLLLYLGIGWVIVAGTRRLLALLRTSAASRIKGIKIQQSEILAAERIARLIAGVVRLARIALLFVLTWLFLGAEFNYFPWTRVHGRQLLEVRHYPGPLRRSGVAGLSPPAVLHPGHRGGDVLRDEIRRAPGARI